MSGQGLGWDYGGAPPAEGTQGQRRKVLPVRAGEATTPWLIWGLDVVGHELFYSVYQYINMCIYIHTYGHIFTIITIIVVQLPSHVQLFATPWTAAPGFPVLHQLPELAQTHVR